MLNMHQLDAFRRVMETGSVTQAASEMFLTQPAVSKLIAALEQHVGFELFRRERQRLAPTAEGRIFYNEVVAIFSQSARLDALARGLRHAESGRLVVGSAPVAGLSILPAILHDFQSSRPDVSVSLEIRSSMKLVELAAMQQVDVAVGLLPSDMATVRCERLYRGEWVCILPPGHRLAGRERIRAEDLAGEPFISLGDEDRSRGTVDAWFDRAGVSRVLRTSVHLGMAACQFVRLGAGVTLLDPVTAFAPANADLVVRRLEDPPDFELLQLLPLSRDPSALREAFIDHLHAWVANWATSIGIGQMMADATHSDAPPP